jgi:hypothetical protein
MEYDPIKEMDKSVIGLVKRGMFVCNIILIAIFIKTHLPFFGFMAIVGIIFYIWLVKESRK